MFPQEVLGRGHGDVRTVQAERFVGVVGCADGWVVEEEEAFGRLYRREEGGDLDSV